VRHPLSLKEWEGEAAGASVTRLRLSDSHNEYLRSFSAQVAPIVQAVAVFFPAVADVGAVIHVGNQDILDARVNLGLRLLHSLARADDDEDYAGSSGDEPLAVDLLDVFDVNFFRGRLFENDGRIFREGIEGFVVIERKRRDHDAHADLKTAADFELGVGAVGEVPEKLADGRDHAGLLDADSGIAETGGEFERVNAVVVDDAIQVYVADVALLGQLGLHFEKRLIEQMIRRAPEHGGAHLARGRANIAGE
jgi:hypothetical protein